VLLTKQMVDAWSLAESQRYKSPLDGDLWVAICFNKDVESARRALGNGANAAMVYPYVTPPGSRQQTALSAAVLYGGTDIVKLLLDNGAKPTDAVAEKKLFEDASRPILIRHSRQRLDSLRYLFNRGVLDNVTVEDILKVMYHISRTGGQYSPDVMRICMQRAVVKGADLSTLLARRGVLPTWLVPQEYTLLHNVTRLDWSRETVELACLLIEYGADVLLEDNLGRTPEDLARLRRPEEDRWRWPKENGVFIRFARGVRLPKENHGTRVIEILEKERLRITKSVAFAMGHHGRLGCASMLAELDPEVLRGICEMAFGTDMHAESLIYYFGGVSARRKEQNG